MFLGFTSFNVKASNLEPLRGAYSDYYLYNDYSYRWNTKNVKINDSVDNATQITYEFVIESNVDYFSYYAGMNCANHNIVGLAFYMEGPNEVFYIYNNTYIYNPNSVDYKPVPLTFTTASDQLINENYFAELNTTYNKYVDTLYIVITFDSPNVLLSTIIEDLYFGQHMINFGFSEYMYKYVKNDFEHPDKYFTDSDNNGYDDNSYYEGYLYGKKFSFTDMNIDGYDDDSYNAARNDFAYYDTLNEEWLGYYDGYSDGYAYGINWAYIQGFQSIGMDPMLSYDGLNYFEEHIDDAKLAIRDFIPGILGAIFAFFFQLASFEVLGISALSILALLVTIAVALLVFKAFFK